jgi:hypothetical protein
VNYDFLDDVKPDQVPGILETYRGGAKGGANGKAGNA